MRDENAQITAYLKQSRIGQAPLTEELAATSSSLLSYYKRKYGEIDEADENEDVIPLTQHELKTAVLSNYDSRKRDPSFAGTLSSQFCYSNISLGAEKEGLWELTQLQFHYHPSVAKWASSLLNNEAIVYNGDPLRDFKLTLFFDRFVFKNPKQGQIGEMINPKTASTMQSGYGMMTNLCSLTSLVAHAERSHPVNTPEFLKQSEANVREDELFFYKYFVRKQTTPSKKKKVKETEEEVMFWFILIVWPDQLGYRC